jgi:CheY-like chemotaxis protein
MPPHKMPLAGLEGARVLIIEDEMLVAVHIAEMLRELGCVPAGTASTVELALAAISDGERIDCATLDVRLDAEISGHVAGVLMAKDIPFVVCSAYKIGLPDFRNIPVLVKPFGKDQLKIGLEQVLLVHSINGLRCEAADAAATVA